MSLINNLFSQLTVLSLLVFHVYARLHHLTLKEDLRQYFKVSTFGYLYGGSLKVNVDNFSFLPYDKGSTFGFTLLKTKNDGLHPYAKEKDVCILDQKNGINRFDESIGLVTITFDLNKKKAIFRCNSVMELFRVDKGFNMNQIDRKKRENLNNEPEQPPGGVGGSDIEPQPKAVDPASGVDPKLVNPAAPGPPKENVGLDQNSNVKPPPNSADVIPPVKEEAINNNENENENNAPEMVANVDTNNADETIDSENYYCKNNHEIELSEKLIDGLPTYSFQFHTLIRDDSLIGLYSLYFHSCPNYRFNQQRSHGPTSINLSMVIEEKNPDGYLSAGEIPLPSLYSTLSMVFFILGLIWIRVIRTRKDDAFKIHYLMGALVFVKALALLFHSIDYHFIAQAGSQNETWAILYYTTHFFKGALLFITIALIGTGWAFVKHILSDKDKKIFMIVIPLQVLANVAEIITEESEEGQSMHNIWRTVFLLVDLICCGAILFPIVWSIKHLQEASQTDGKAAMNLLKLKLFRRFYVMIVCYIYFTRIIVFILRLIVPFQYEWLDIFFQHMATLLFFISTGYHFQPTHSNPYFQLSQQEDLEMEEVLFNVTPNVYIASSTKKRVKEKENSSSEDRHSLLTKRDNSHDFD